MGAKVSHMNLFAMSTIIEADDLDLENLLRNFEGKKNTYSKIKHESTGKEYENVPTRANPLEQQYIVDALELVLERQEQEAAAKAAAVKAAEEEEARKLQAEKETAMKAKLATKNSMSGKSRQEKEAQRMKQLQEEAERKRKEEEENDLNRPATPPLAMLDDILPETGVGMGDLLPGMSKPQVGLVDDYENAIENEKLPERDEQFHLDSSNVGSGNASSNGEQELGSRVDSASGFNMNNQRGIELEPGSDMNANRSALTGTGGNNTNNDNNENIDNGSVGAGSLEPDVSLLGGTVCDDIQSIGEQTSVRFDMGRHDGPVYPGGSLGTFDEGDQNIGDDGGEGEGYGGVDGNYPLNGDGTGRQANDASGSVVSVAGGGTIVSSTSVTSEMRGKDKEVHSFYHEVENAQPKGFDLPDAYMIDIEDCLQLCQRCGFGASDVDLVEAMFRLVDQRGFENADIRHVLVPFALCIGTKSGKIPETLRLVFGVFDRAMTEVVSKEQMLQIFNLINEALLYLGDKPLHAKYITDLVDSVFTTAGKIDGSIQWVEYVELISEHPIIEMLVAPQYQGLARDKVFDEDTLESKDVSVGVDYTAIV